MGYRVRFSEDADRQLRELGLYIAERKSAGVAARYIEAIVKECYALATFPQRGTARGRLLTGLRTIGFRRRVVIAFRVQEDSVEILAVLYGGQSLAKYFRQRNDRT